MILKLEKFLEAKIGLQGIYIAGLIIVGLILLPHTLHKPTPVEHDFLPYLTEKEREFFKSGKEKREWCKRNNDCKVLAEAIVYEARSESELGQVSVAHTILNRVDHPQWGDSIKEVVYQPYQFSYTLAKQRNIPSKKDWENGYMVAYEVLNEMVESPVGDANHYHRADLKPYPKWAKKLEYVMTVDSHVFYR